MMVCQKPFYRGSSAYPCGQCLCCRINRSRIWAARMQMELATVKGEACFLTLTYSDEACPPSLDPSHLTAALKRLRYHIEGKKITYYACGEYGRQTWRPHYHAGIFGHRFEPGLYAGREPFKSIWPHGGVHVTPFQPATALYCAKHLAKGIRPEKEHEFMHPEFSRMSRRPALGARYVEDVLAEYYTTAAGCYELSTTLDVPTAILGIDNRSAPLGRFLRQRLRMAIGWEPRVPELAAAVREIEAQREYPEIVDRVRAAALRRQQSAHDAQIWLAKSYHGEKN